MTFLTPSHDVPTAAMQLTFYSPPRSAFLFVAVLTIWRCSRDFLCAPNPKGIIRPGAHRMSDAQDQKPKPQTAEAQNAEPQAPLPMVVAFEHKFFSSFEDVYFRMSEHTNAPVCIIKLADNDAALTLPGIKREFSIADDSPDGIMLDVVADGLNYVKALRPGDPVPKEITTREASWEPSDRHRQIAYQRLTMQMVTWLTGDEHLVTNPEELLQIANDPQIKKNVALAFDQAAEHIGIGRERREEVIHYIEDLARELSYIEAMRDVFLHIKQIEEKIQGLRRIYGHERSVMEVADQVARLAGRAVKSFEDIFEEIDAQTGEVISMLKNIDSQSAYIRSKRDELHRRLMPWDEIIEAWKLVEVRVRPESPDALRDIYQFLAPRFMQVNEWVLVGKIQMASPPGHSHLGNEKKAKPKGKIMKW